VRVAYCESHERSAPRSKSPEVKSSQVKPNQVKSSHVLREPREVGAAVEEPLRDREDHAAAAWVADCGGESRSVGLWLSGGRAASSEQRAASSEQSAASSQQPAAEQRATLQQTARGPPRGRGIESEVRTAPKAACDLHVARGRHEPVLHTAAADEPACAPHTAARASFRWGLVGRGLRWVGSEGE
jgi:hypothetical protein